MTTARQRHNEANRAYYARNSEHIKQRVREYRRANPEKIRALSKAYRLRKKARRGYDALHNSANLDYYWRNRELILERNKRRRQLKSLL